MNHKSKSLLFGTSAYQSHEIQFNESEFLDWLKNYEYKDEEIYSFMNDFLTNRYQGLLFRDGEVIEEIEYDVSKEFEQEFEFILDTLKNNV